MTSSRDADATWKWVFRKVYGRRPKPEELGRYKYSHGVSRQISFAASGPWENWPLRPIPDNAQPAADAVQDVCAQCAPARSELAPALACSRDDVRATSIDRAEPAPAPAVVVANGADEHHDDQPRRRRRMSKRAEGARTALLADETRSQAERLLRRRLAGASWPRSALVAEARLARISEAAIDTAAARLDVRIRDGRWSLAPNGHAHEPGLLDEPMPVQCPDERPAMRAARMWIRRTLADGPQPEAAVARRLAEMGLARWRGVAKPSLGGAEVHSTQCENARYFGTFFSVLLI